MSIVKSYEREYIRKVVTGQDRKNLLVNVVADRHYRVYPNVVEYYSAPPGQDYLINPGEKDDCRKMLGTNHFWHL